MDVAIRLMASVAILVSGLMPMPAGAQSFDVAVAQGVICDTQKQAERFAALLSDDAEKAATTVNDEQKDPTACVIATVSYVRGNDIVTVRNRTGTYRVIRILVLGVLTEGGMQATVPAPFYSIEAVDERTA